MSDASSAVPMAETPISPVSAVVGTFSRPSETFRRLVARPTWWLPFVLVLIATIVSWLVVAPKMDMDRTVRESIEKQAEKSGRTIPPEAIDRQVQMSKKMMPVFFAAVVVGGAVLFFFAALVLWGSAKA
ncbi:MAG TPA: YIP1 family protein, partial [Thermoanaerobaculia bacterium]|nr:YIP1 family protein [Thermoanaerobaculia bacterium]